MRKETNGSGTLSFPRDVMKTAYVTRDRVMSANDFCLDG